MKNSKKEDLIILEIVNKNYNPQMFYNYLDSKTEYGSDMKNWRYNELADEIEKYKKIISGDENPIARNNTNLGQYKEWNEYGEGGEPNTEGISQQENLSELDVYEYEFPSNNQISINEFFKTPDIKVTIDESSVKTNFIFFSETYYRVQVSPMGWTVNRTFNDFVLLKDSLKKSYPFVVVS